MQNSYIPSQKRLTRQLLQDTLQILSASFFNPSNPKSQVITDIIKNCEPFHSIFSSPVKLNEFSQLAIFNVNYEVFDYGSAVQQEGGLVDKICIILEGNIEEIQRKPEKETQDDRRYKTFQGEKVLGMDLEIRNSQSFPQVSRGEKSPFMTEISLISKASIPEQQQKTTQDLKVCLTSRRKMMQLTLPSIFEEDNISRKKVETTRALTKADMISFEREALLQTARTCDDSDDTYSLSSLESLNNFKLSPEDEKLLEIATQSNPKIKEDFLHARKVKTFYSGDHFGAGFCQSVPTKSDSMLIVSSQKAHLLTLSTQNYNKIIKQLEKQQNEKVELLTNIFPSFEKNAIKRFSEFFSQKTFSKDEVIYSQYDATQHLYLIHAGEVRLFRSLSSSSSGLTSPSSLYPQKANEILLASMMKGQFFGEEKLIDKEQRIYTAISNSHNTVAWVLEASVYEQIKLKFESFFGALKEQAQEKFIWRAQRAVDLLKIPQSPNPPLKKITSVQLLTPRGGVKLGQEIPTHFERLQAYKSNFSRQGILSNTLESPKGKLNRPVSLKSLDFSPVKDLTKYNLRKDLYNFDENGVVGQCPTMAMTERGNVESVSAVIKPKLKFTFIGEKLVKKQKKREKRDQAGLKTFRLSKGGSKIVRIGGQGQSQSQPEI